MAGLGYVELLSQVEKILKDNGKPMEISEIKFELYLLNWKGDKTEKELKLLKKLYLADEIEIYMIKAYAPSIMKALYALINGPHVRIVDKTQFQYKEVWDLKKWELGFD